VVSSIGFVFATGAAARQEVVHSTGNGVRSPELAFSCLEVTFASFGLGKGGFSEKGEGLRMRE
jgi:hypothetical protein